jgi:hypothetical protein
MPFRPSSEQAATMNNVLEPSCHGHKHCVTVQLGEELSRASNDWWDHEVMNVPLLAFKACIIKPQDICIKMRPAKMLKQLLSSCKLALVSKRVVGLL